VLRVGVATGLGATLTGSRALSRGPVFTMHDTMHDTEEGTVR
jgi:hypothetical protein